jgi:hypothetical protein
LEQRERQQSLAYALPDGAGDPCEETTYSYQVGGVPVSDFVLPSYYRTPASDRPGKYSHTGAVSQPLELLEGGYISFFDPTTGRGWQRFKIKGELQDRELPLEHARFTSLREFSDHQARAFRSAQRGQH